MKLIHILFYGTAFLLSACSPEVNMGTADYSSLHFDKSCTDSNAKSSLYTRVDRREISDGIAYSVRTPANYDATLGHPLIVVYAPGGYHRYQSEKYANLTTEATARGFVIAYVDHAPLRLGSFDILGKVPNDISVDWCIDKNRIYLTGHSDGGLSSEAVSFLRTSPLQITAIVASGAGIRDLDLASYPCPKVTATMIIHSKTDELFPPPRYGLGAANWWAACNKCQSKFLSLPEEGCIELKDCASAGQTKLCSTNLKHSSWHELNDETLDFFTANRK